MALSAVPLSSCGQHPGSEDTVGERRCVFLASLYRAERDIAERLQSLVGRAPPWPALDVDKAVPWLEQRGGLTLAPSQREALRLAVMSKILVITGGPGVGKTTLVNSILKVLVAKSVNVALCAPTGRAAILHPSMLHSRSHYLL